MTPKASGAVCSPLSSWGNFALFGVRRFSAAFSRSVLHTPSQTKRGKGAALQKIAQLLGEEGEGYCCRSPNGETRYQFVTNAEHRKLMRTWAQQAAAKGISANYAAALKMIYRQLTTAPRLGATQATN